MRIDTLTKEKLSKAINQKVGLNQREAKDIVEAFFDLIKVELVNGSDVKLPGFGSFTLKDKSSRVGRNPLTMKPAKISSRRVVTFKVSPLLKRVLKRC